MVIKVEALSYADLTPWTPTPANLPENWMKLANKLAQQAKGSPHPYILDVKYDARRVGNLLHADDPGDTGWHVDLSFPGPSDDPNERDDFSAWRVNVTSRGRPC